MSANSPEPLRRVEVVLLKAGRTKIRYEAELLNDDGNRVTVRAPWAGRASVTSASSASSRATSSPSTTGATAGTPSRRSAPRRAP